MLTKRDRQLMIFLEDYGAAETKHLIQLFFPNVSGRRARQRLTALTEQGHIKRQRSNINSDYVYYLDKKPQQLEHTLIRVDVLCRLKALYTVLRHIPEFSIGECRADAYIELQKGGGISSEQHYSIKVAEQKYNFFLEVQLSNRFNQSKYENLYNSGLWQNELPAFPRILVVSDRSILIKPSDIIFVVIKSDLTELPQICDIYGE